MDSGFRIPVMIKNPKPTKVFRIGDIRNRNDHKVEFLGW
jgi:hypothetical protein